MAFDEQITGKENVQETVLPTHDRPEEELDFEEILSKFNVENTLRTGEERFDEIEEAYQPGKDISHLYESRLNIVWSKMENLAARAKKEITAIIVGGNILLSTLGFVAEAKALEKPEIKNPEGAKFEELQKVSNQQTELGKAGIVLVEKQKRADINWETNHEYRKKISKLERSAFEDDFEKVLITSENSDGQMEFAENGKDEERRNFSTISFSKIENFIKNGAKKVEITHTHPWAALPGYLINEKIRNGKPVPMPPSVSDLTGSIVMSGYFEESNKLIENKIIDPTGEWTYSIKDESNYFVKKYLEFFNECASPDFFEKNLTEEEKEKTPKYADFKNIHPELRRLYVPKRFLEKMENKFIQQFPEKNLLNSFGEDKSMYLKSYIKIFELNSKIGTYDENRTKKETEALIEEYTKECKKIGFEVSYKPFND